MTEHAIVYSHGGGRKCAQLPILAQFVVRQQSAGEFTIVDVPDRPLARLSRQTGPARYRPRRRRDARRSPCGLGAAYAPLGREDGVAAGPVSGLYQSI
jgi:hypothetical protein